MSNHEESHLPANDSDPPNNIHDQSFDQKDDIEQQSEENVDEFIRITAAHQTLIEAQTHDEKNNYLVALHLYRACVDFLLEELMFAESTEQSRIYLREKSTAILDRIDLLKTKLEPVSPSIPTDQLKTLPLS